GRGSKTPPSTTTSLGARLSVHDANTVFRGWQAINPKKVARSQTAPLTAITTVFFFLTLCREFLNGSHNPIHSGAEATASNFRQSLEQRESRITVNVLFDYPCDLGVSLGTAFSLHFRSLRPSVIT